MEIIWRDKLVFASAGQGAKRIGGLRHTTPTAKKQDTKMARRDKEQINNLPGGMHAQGATRRTRRRQARGRGQLRGAGGFGGQNGIVGENRGECSFAAFGRTRRQLKGSADYGKRATSEVEFPYTCVSNYGGGVTESERPTRWSFFLTA